MEFINTYQLWFILRMVAASVCGMIIGLERKNRSKEAGMRTHCVVACAAALMMVISKYGFTDLAIGENGMRGADGARIAAQVVSGIGFLGAGMIFVHKNTVTGLTTAAGIWATAGIGMAIGAGMYIVGFSATIIIILAQIMLHRKFKWVKASKLKKITVNNVDTPNFQKNLTEKLEENGISVYDVYINKNKDAVCYTFIVEIPDSFYEEDILSFVKFDCKIDADT